MIFVLLMVLAYFVGAIPFGLLLGRLFADVDVREFGSGNIGATNVNRVLGRKLGAATLLCDVVKGMTPVLMTKILLPDDPMAPAWVGLVAFLGHCYPIYLRFRGGKGVATAFGILIPISPLSALIALGAWITVVRITRVSAMGALVASLSIPFSVGYFERDWTEVFIFVVVVSVVIYRHKENIQRLRAGTEK